MKTARLVLLLFVLSLVSLVLETTIIAFPLVFLLGIATVFFKRSIRSFIFAYVIGIAIDSLRLTNFGITPIAVFITFMAILLFEKYSGSKDIVVSGVLIFTALLVYTVFLNYSLINLILISFLILVFILCYRFFQNRKQTGLDIRY